MLEIKYVICEHLFHMGLCPGEAAARGQLAADGDVVWGGRG